MGDKPGRWGIISGNAFQPKYTQLILVAMVGIALSTYLCLVARQIEGNRMHAAFDERADERITAVNRAMEFILYDIEMLGTFFDGSEYVTRDEFKTYTKAMLEQGVGIQALEWIPRVAYEKREEYETAARESWFPDFSITERKSQGEMVPAGRRDEYFPVYYVEPYTGNEIALGFDLASNPTRLEGLNNSRDTGRITATARITLVQEKENQYGFLIFRPVYRKNVELDTEEKRRENLEGFILGVYRVEDILEKSAAFINITGIDTYLYDITAPMGKQYLSSQVSHQRGHALAAEDFEKPELLTGLHRKATFDVGGRRWLVQCKPTSEFILTRRTWQPWGVLGLGLLLTGLLTAYISHILKHSDRMHVFATEQLKAKGELADEIADRIQAEKQLQQRTYDLAKRVKELNGLYNITKLIEKPEIALVDMLQGITELIPPAFQFPDDTCARILLDNQEYKTDNFTETPWGLTTGIMVYGERKGAIEVYIKKDPSGNGGKLFLEEESELLHEVATQVGRIIERKRAQEELWLFDALMDQSNDSLTIVDPEDGRFLAVNEKACITTGYDLNEFLKLKVPDIDTAIPDGNVFREIVNLLRESGPQLMEGISRKKDGSTIPVETSIKYVASENRDYIIAVTRDITERKKAQEELHRQKECAISESGKLRKALEQLKELLKAAERSQSFDVRFENPNIKTCWEIMECNQESCPCYGARNLRCWQIAGTHCGGAVQGIFAQKISHCEECEVFHQAAADPILEIGETFNNLMAILENKHRALVQANKTLGEMNERLKANQNQLVQSEKMASIGQLSAGVAHEINNPVGFVKSNLGTLTGYVKTFKALFEEYKELAGAISASDTKKQVAVLEKVEEITEKDDLPYILEDIDNLLTESIDGTERVRDIVQNLKSFARVDETQIKEADINEGIEATLKIVWNELKYKCTVHKNLSPLPLIRCYSGQLNQVFMNILVNAVQAIPEKGDITIESKATDSHIIVKISDTGVGIRQENIPRLFDPFFTTKDVGKGTGLGLSISHAIVRKHDGTIDVESEIGKGSTFIIRLPIGGVSDDG